MSKLSIKKRVQLLLNDFNYCAMTVKSISIHFNKQFVYVFTKDILFEFMFCLLGTTMARIYDDPYHMISVMT